MSVDQCIAVVITAAGLGSRFSSQLPKQFQNLDGKPVLRHAIDVFESMGLVDHIVLVLPKDFLPQWSKESQALAHTRKIYAVLEGGASRQASVHIGLQALKKTTTLVAIHDGARPLVLAQDVERAIDTCKGLDGAICAQPIRDSLKKVREGLISHDVDREDVWAMQTPQVFHYPWILQVYDQAEKEGHCATDDASLAQRYGGKVCVVPSSSFNIKITYPEDLDWAQRILDMRKQEAQ